MATPTNNTPQKHVPAFTSPAPRSVPNTGTINTGMMNFDSPAALGLLAEGVGGVGMGISMSGLGMSSLGITASAMGRADEDERRRRLESIISMLKAKPGRVGVKGIVDLCHQEDLEVQQERNSIVLLIGSEGMVEIPLKQGEIATDGVALELMHDRHNYAATASKILGRSLEPLPGMPKINLTLQRFAHNLDKLLRMDRLSSPQNGGISCYQAIFGVYASLKKLFDHEKKLALDLMDAKDPWRSQRAEREVLCKKSGRPRINARDCLGVSIEYWMDRRHLLPDETSDSMETDSGDDYPEDKDPDTHQIFSLTIECESSPSSMYTPIKISDAWISDAIEKAPDATDNSDLNNILLNRPTLDWLDPPPTYLPSADTGDQDAMHLDNAPGRLPNIRFVAKLNPPVTVPWSVYVNIQNSLGFTVTNEQFRPTTFVGLVLRPDEPDPGMAGISSDTTPEFGIEKPVTVINKDGNEEERQHSISLYVPRTEYSRTIDALPFSHPRQLMEILPMLRQYAFTTSLLKHTFGTTKASPQRSTNGSQEKTEPPTQVDISLFYALPSAPRARFDIPYPSSTPLPTTLNPASSSTTAAGDILAQLLSPDFSASKPPLSVTLDVLPNAELVIADQNIVDVDDKKKDANAAGDVNMDMGETDERVKRIATALDVCMDVGVWSEWVRREVASREQE